MWDNASALWTFKASEIFSRAPQSGKGWSIYFVYFFYFVFFSSEEECEHKGIIYEELLVVVTWKLFFISMFLLYQFVSFNWIFFSYISEAVHWKQENTCKLTAVTDVKIPQLPPSTYNPQDEVVSSVTQDRALNHCITFVVLVPRHSNLDPVGNISESSLVILDYISWTAKRWRSGTM